MESDTRDTRLEELRGDDPELFREVYSLLAADADNTSILDGFAIDTVDLSEFLSKKGTRVGPFILEDQIGSGGMGSVYMAKRVEGGFEQVVALKLIKEGLNNKLILKKFESERSILARLQHPNIARLVDGGSTKEGRPWFAMEYVQGEPIDEYCKNNNVSLKERVKLFKRVTDAVQYAHRNLIVHRDLKPFNILVSGDDKNPQIKLLDFGIAQLIDDSISSDVQSKAHTKAYASPEQKRGEATSTLTDIYSLGIVFKELLTGIHPQKDFRSSDEKPAEISGELRAICEKAMREEPEARYQTVAEFNDDLENWEQNKPVQSFSNQPFYVFKKFVSRNRASALICLFSVLAIVFLVLFYTSELQKEKEIAQREAERSAKIASVLGSSLGSVDPTQTAAGELSAKTLLDNSLSYIDSELKDDPDIQSNLYTTMAGVYANLGLFTTADSVSELSYNYFVAVADTQDTEYITTLSERSDILLQGGNFDEAGSLIERAVVLADQNMDRQSIAYADVLYNWNNYLYHKADYPKADSVLNIIKPIYEKNRDEYESYYQDIIFFLGTNYRKMGMYDSAEVYLKQALELSREIYDEPNEIIASNLNHMSSLYQNMDEPEKALPYAIESYEQRRQVFGEDHINTIASQANTARTYGGVGNYEKSAELYESVIEKFKRLYGENNFNLAGLTQSLGSTYLRMGDFENAEANMRKSLEISERLLSADNIRQAFPLHGMADILFQKGDFEQALTYARRALEIRENILEDDTPLLAHSRYMTGLCLWNLDERQEARELLLKAKAFYESDPERYGDELEKIKELDLD